MASSSEDRALKVRINRARRAAERQGYALHRSRRRDPRAIGFGTYWLTEVSTVVTVVAGEADRGGSSLDEIEQRLGIAN